MINDDKGQKSVSPEYWTSDLHEHTAQWWKEQNEIFNRNIENKEPEKCNTLA